MLDKSYPLYVAAHAEQPNAALEVTDKYSGEVATRVALADAATIERAIAAADAAAGAMAALPTYRRMAALHHCARRIAERAEEFAFILAVEAGKPLQFARGEVARAIDTFRIAGEEAPRMAGQVFSADRIERNANVIGMWKRVPVGPVSLISPWNFPLNLVAHKVAPAIAAGCPFVLKPASRTPVSALVLGEILADAELPEGAFSILPCRREDAAPLVEDDRLKLLSFTGSDEVGWDMKARAGKKRVTLELGGNAACIVDEDADLDDAAQRMTFGAFYQSGQSCISVQRILVHEAGYEAFKSRFLACVKALKMGDPKAEDTYIGPMITEEDAARLETWIQSAAARGARILIGGRRQGAMMEPTLVEDAPVDEMISCQEAFGPVATLSRFRDFEAALAEANRSRYGLQAGVFTRDLHKAHKAWDTLRVGGVIIGDVPSWRADQMPYGGTKDSGIGREGPYFAIEDMTEIRLMAIRGI